MARAACRVALLSALLVGAAATGTGQGVKLMANPVRKVVTMLQMMQKKIIAEGEKEEELFEKFMCYCKTGTAGLEKSIADAQVKIPQLESDIEAALGENAKLMEDVEAHKKDRAAAKVAMAEATSIREKEAKAFAAETAEAKANIAAMAAAIAALEKGMGMDSAKKASLPTGIDKLSEHDTLYAKQVIKDQAAAGFLQTSVAAKLKSIAVGSESSLNDAERDMLVSFLAQGQGENAGYAPASGEIVGILKQMKDTFEKELAATIKTEEAAIAEYEALMAAKTKEVNALTKAIEEKMVRLGDLGVQVVNMKEELEDTKVSLAEDTKFLADLKKSCATKDEEWKARCKTRAEEIVAIADTIKILNDDDALELFKKTLPSPSLLQVQVSAKEVRNAALRALRRGSGVHLDLVSLAIRGKKVSFDKIITMIDEMVALLAKEQTADEEKKAYCEKDIDEAEDTLKELAYTISGMTKAIDEAKATVEALVDEIAALVEGIKTLDKQVAEATATRKEEHEDYVENLAANNAAKELLGIAKNRMNKFYNPKMYKAPPKRDLSEDERITVNMGGTLAPTMPPGGIAGTGVEAFFAQVRRAKEQQQVAPPPPPETFGAYAKKGEESGGVIEMINLMIKDLSKEITEMEFDEKDAQEDYEKFIADSAEKRASDSKSIAEKEAMKADLEAQLEKLGLEKKSKQEEEMATMKALNDLHLECDWLLKNFQLRKEARASEVDSLKQAKAVLSGADYSLVQMGSRTHLRRGVRTH